MNKKIFSEKYLKDTLHLPQNAIKEEFICDTSYRIIYEIIFQDINDKKYYATFYNHFYGAGKTKYQFPWYTKKIMCWEVEPTTELIKTTKWVIKDY